MAQASFNTNNAAAVAVAFTLTSTSGRDAGYTAVAAGTPSEPLEAEIRHTVKPVGAAGVDRHAVQLRKTVINDTTGVVSVAKVNITFEIPRDAEVTPAVVKDLWYEGKNYVTDANLALITAGITP